MFIPIYILFQYYSNFLATFLYENILTRNFTPIKKTRIERLFTTNIWKLFIERPDIYRWNKGWTGYFFIVEGGGKKKRGTIDRKKVV